MKKTIVLLFLIFSTQAFTETVKSIAGKLVTNVQESNGETTDFSLMTEQGLVKLEVQKGHHSRALYKLSGNILIMTGEVKSSSVEDINFDDIDDSISFNRDVIASSRARVPDFDDFDIPDFPDFPLDGFDMDAKLKVTQYTVTITNEKLVGKIKSEWSNGSETYFLKLESGEDKVVSLLEDDQLDFFEKYHDKQVQIEGSQILLNNSKKFMVSKIKSL